MLILVFFLRDTSIIFNKRLGCVRLSYLLIVLMCKNYLQ